MEARVFAMTRRRGIETHHGGGAFRAGIELCESCPVGPRKTTAGSQSPFEPAYGLQGLLCFLCRIQAASEVPLQCTARGIQSFEQTSV
jgi:hypothetical protein